MTEEEHSGPNELVIAVYLDTNVLLDLLATVEDGFRLVERITTGQTRGKSSDQSAEAEFATPSLFNFFKVGFSGKLGRASVEGTSETKETELTHTYGSLLHRLRRYLLEENLLTALGSGTAHPTTVGSFIEFTGVARPNPFTDSFHRLRRILSFAEIATTISSPPTPAHQGNKGNRGQNPGRATPARQQSSQLAAIGSFLEKLTGDVEREGTSTVLFENEPSKYRAVVTLFDDFLRDRSMAELMNREFRILGKVARHLSAGSQGGVDLLASSGVAGFPPEILGELSEMMESLSNEGWAQLHSPSTTINPPVIEIVPIAIYL
ncbi:MAG: DUF6414 family protein [Ferrimicrobium sp.]